MDISEEEFLHELLLADPLRRPSQTSSWEDSSTSTATTSFIPTPITSNYNFINRSSNNNVWSSSNFSANANSSYPIISSSVSSSWGPPIDPETFTTSHIPDFNHNVFQNQTAFSAAQQQQHHHNHQICPSLSVPQMMEDEIETASFYIQDDFNFDQLSAFDDHASLLAKDQQAMMMMMTMVQDNQGLKMEPAFVPTDLAPPAVFNAGCGGSDILERKIGRLASKKVQGQPSKNLMAERRRRKRLNDRLSMLRSIVPKISKMDRTAILGDTIDYMKELLERIQRLQEELDNSDSSDDQVPLIDLFKDPKPNEVQITNTPKFEVERRKKDTRVEICCSGKSGLVLSTVNTMEKLGLQMEQCVISCFNDFAMHASCSENMTEGSETDCEEIKQALFRNAGYGGRCL